MWVWYFGSSAWLQGKSGSSSKDSTLFGVSFSDHLKADFNSSGLRCKVVTYTNISCSLFFLFFFFSFSKENIIGLSLTNVLVWFSFFTSLFSSFVYIQHCKSLLFLVTLYFYSLFKNKQISTHIYVYERW